MPARSSARHQDVAFDDANQIHQADRELELRSRRRRLSALEAGDPAALLVRWIDELVFLAEMEGLVPGRAARIELAGRKVRATVKFRAGTPRNFVKGATYHRLSFEQRDGRWHATVVLDV